MNKTIIFIIVTLIIIGGFIWLLHINGNKLAESPEEYSTPSHEEAELVGFNFILDFIKIAPPQSNSEAEESAYQSLSLNAKEKLNRQNLANDLAGFIGVQDVPDQGVSVEDLQINDEKSATLVVGLNYSGGRVVRHIHLVAEKGEWKVDRVTTPEEKINFNQTGNLVYGGPGREEGVWYLVYDEPGASAKSVKLNFKDSSICGGAPCLDIIVEEMNGIRVSVEGNDTDGQVEVDNLTFSDAEQRARFIARYLIVNYSPTFLFDGMNLKFLEARKVDSVDCEDCFEVDFSFDSRHSGYGNREGEALAQVITPHKITLLIKGNSAERAITDGIFDEMKGGLIN